MDLSYPPEAGAFRINGLRTLSSVWSGKRDPGVAALGATNKMFWSEYHRDVMELALDVIVGERVLGLPKEPDRGA